MSIIKFQSFTFVNWQLCFFVTLQVLQVINPTVSNANRSAHYAAVILDDLKKIGVHCDRLAVEKDVRRRECGNTVDNRYFLKEGVNASTIQGQPKRNLHKARCCTLSKDVLSTDVLRRLNQG